VFVLAATALRGAAWAPVARGLLVIPMALFTAAAWAALVEWRAPRAIDPSRSALLGCAWIVMAELLVLAIP
jgi:hypothetical protein